ncbi:MAG: aldo/keto reductase [Clostridiaceae bacterium]|nr:aldo/keto reductase [Clostridiaceae bacterium]
MQYRKFGKTNIEVSTLGFGCMRFPCIPDGNINEEEAIKQLRTAIDNGVNYLDTAYVYHNGKSEVVLGKALKDGYREKVYIADKLPTWSAHVYEDFEKLLDKQLERLQVEFIDFYLIHALNKGSFEKVKDLGIYKFIDKALMDGKIKHIGFSFHDNIETFKTIVDDYNWEFCQIQLNYMDEFNQAGLEGLYYAAAKDLAVIIMEPLLGGKLANIPPEPIKELWDLSEKKRTPAEWALTWLWDKPEVTVILSGMNSMEQLTENINIAGTIKPNSLSKEEKELINKVKIKYTELTKVGCTGCNYCVDCPKGINIPNIFSIYNEAYMYNALNTCSTHYTNSIKKENNASACIECKKCEKICPQVLNITQHLKDAHRELTSI